MISTIPTGDQRKKTPQDGQRKALSPSSSDWLDTKNHRNLSLSMVRCPQQLHILSYIRYFVIMLLVPVGAE